MHRCRIVTCTVVVKVYVGRLLIGTKFANLEVPSPRYEENYLSVEWPKVAVNFRFRRCRSRISSLGSPSSIHWFDLVVCSILVENFRD